MSDPQGYRRRSSLCRRLSACLDTSPIFYLTLLSDRLLVNA
ncbi:hypothetical protein P7L53_01950 [Thermoleptolyngbya sichuanensis XZ-Cy5]|nr:MULTISPECIES: hypothetical protein [Thermoleptolyngbya]MDG2614997.1 hypothetical protein [Thermoleptolyngbya sichuanensis XZ-Cy5]